jgi:hypothetical protein
MSSKQRGGTESRKRSVLCSLILAHQTSTSLPPQFYDFTLLPIHYPIIASMTPGVYVGKYDSRGRSHSCVASGRKHWHHPGWKCGSWSNHCCISRCVMQTLRVEVVDKGAPRDLEVQLGQKIQVVTNGNASAS